jgi:predicted RecB family endonuclease
MKNFTNTNEIKIGIEDFTKDLKEVGGEITNHALGEAKEIGKKISGSLKKVLSGAKDLVIAKYKDDDLNKIFDKIGDKLDKGFDQFAKSGNFKDFVSSVYDSLKEFCKQIGEKIVKFVDNKLLKSTKEMFDKMADFAKETIDHGITNVGKQMMVKLESAAKEMIGQNRAR